MSASARILTSRRNYPRFLTLVERRLKSDDAEKKLAAMSKPISRLWLLGPPFAIFISLVAYYAKFPSMRRWVDDKFPWVEVNIGRRLPPIAEESRSSASPRRTTTPPAPAPIAIAPTTPEPRPLLALPPPPPSYVSPDGKVDIAKLAADRNAWPKTVVLKTAKEFPAVINGKTVGKVEVPAGTEAELVSIQDGKLGVKFQGGGAWFGVEETDLAERLRH